MGAPLLTPQAENELIKLFPHHPTAVVAERLGLNLRQVQHLALQRGLKKTAATRSASRRMRPRTGITIAQRVEDAVKAAGRQGLTRAAALAALPEVGEGQVDAALAKNTALRRIHRAGKRRASRWFASQADAEAFAALVQPRILPRPELAAAPAAQAPASTPKQPRGEPVITAATRFTQCPGVPGPEARWHGGAQPVFQDLGPGHYDAEPSSWVAAVTAVTAKG